MIIEIKDEAIQQMVEEKAKNCVAHSVNLRLKEMDWFKSIDHMIRDIVEQKVTDQVIASVIAGLDKQQLVQRVSQELAESVAKLLE